MQEALRILVMTGDIEVPLPSRRAHTQSSFKSKRVSTVTDTKDQDSSDDDDDDSESREQFKDEQPRPTIGTLLQEASCCQSSFQPNHLFL